MAYEKKINGRGVGGRIVSVEPKPSKGFTSKVTDLLEKLVVKLFYDSSLPHHYLSGNSAPVTDETPPTKDFPVRGFDGDGMIHGLRIKDGKAAYVSRLVTTSRFKQEEYFGGAKVMTNYAPIAFLFNHSAVVTCKTGEGILSCIHQN